MEMQIQKKYKIQNMYTILFREIDSQGGKRRHYFLLLQNTELKVLFFSASLVSLERGDGGVYSVHTLDN